MPNRSDVSRATEPVFSHDPWLRVYIDDVASRSGRYRYARIVESDGHPGVVVLPLCGRLVGLVKQFRVPIGKSLWELPRGFGDGDRPLKDAQRELREETGIETATWGELGRMFPNSGLLAGEVRLFYALIDPENVARPTKEGEVDFFRWWRIDELRGAIKEDRVVDGFTLATLYKAELAGLLD